MVEGNFLENLVAWKISKIRSDLKSRGRAQLSRDEFWSQPQLNMYIEIYGRLSIKNICVVWSCKGCKDMKYNRKANFDVK